MRRRYWIAAGVVAVAIVAAGSAFAATKLESPGARSQAVIKDAAGRLHVTPGALSSALRKALDDQIDAAVAAGRLTKAQGDAMKARIAAGPLPLGGFGSAHWGAGPPLGLGFRHERPRILGPGMFGRGVRAVTSYLGLTPAQLRAELATGKSLAQIAKAHGKTAAGLVAALMAETKSRLDRAAAAKHLSAAQEQAILSRLRTVFEGLVHRTPVAALPWMLLRPRLAPGWGRHPLRPYPPLLKRGPCTASSSCDTS
jgi:hypothetical protein